MMLEIKNLSVSFSGKKLLENINMTVHRGARHLLAGHNGSGKSTLVGAICGNPAYTLDSGKIIFDGHDITNETPTMRSLLGIFVGAQNVPEIPGLTVLSFLKHSLSAHYHFNNGQDLSMGELLQEIESARETLSIPRDWLNRSVNVGFSGGERKKLMLLQLILTKPKLAILDEPDSGADADTRKQISNTIKSMPDTTFIFISHQPDFTASVVPTETTILSDGKIVLE